MWSVNGKTLISIIFVLKCLLRYMILKTFKNIQRTGGVVFCI